MLIKNKAFTLMEILTVITILVIVIIGINTTTLIKISDSQKVGIFKNKIKSNIETAINNSLIGKAVDNNLGVPTFWKIDINNNYNGTGLGTGNIIISYGSGTFQIYTGLTIKANNFYRIDNIKCDNIGGTNQSNVSNISLLIRNGNIVSNGCTDSDQKIITFDIFYKGYKKYIKINSINNVINSN